MADPQHTPITNFQDKFTVVLYRIGIMVMAVAAILSVVNYFVPIEFIHQRFIPLFAAGAALSSAHVHLYDPRFRYFIPLMTWIGLVLLGFNSTVEIENVPTRNLWSSMALGFFYAGASMFAIKEQFCFRIPGLQLVPIFLFISVIAHYVDASLIEIISLSPAAILLLWLSIAKWKMPLHFDIGDKSKYTV